ncbi:aminopeptidase N [Chitinimonas sp. BJB300]|uniref:aminopeptidase N n=1 Tax=Chitinimonas sp. BJB300 TaxID=1559339 RepID=UPI000C112965|nr:aminopeptidase N [Chitinimonas sp. BJB300]PHV10683.1 aminopeptidase N [Chitinimonas sp. BJB300]TSJ90763.1 aminopeptidase N [Chitinimonas sp. BJB300]
MAKLDANTPQAIQLHDYTPPVFMIDKVDLTFELDETQTRVTSRLVLHRNPEHPDPRAALCLQGRELTLESVKLDGEALETGHYSLDAESLTIASMPDNAILEIITLIHPETNTSLNGLYRSGANFYSQCEAEGFRKITYYLDRPDVMARFSTTIVADKQKWPILLSNGNKVGEGQLDKCRHWVKWVDPFKKPAYLFALVAGKLAKLSDKFRTASGREVALEIFVEPSDLDKCDHAMASVKKSMAWDEQRYGLEYDLDTYMIVAVSDFNMGAMENKGLNIFNTKYVLARPDTATDMDFDGIESVIAHEYFHNWTGNRVTCRDWFQLSLKEGLTVFRDQEFSADMGSADVCRIDAVRVLRTHQFAEDAGPMAHPIRPESYIEINNFYTVTVYEKGAEVVRMYQTLLGRDGFRKGMDLYFKRHDGQAVTCDDFRTAMADANDYDLEQFSRWYSQAGTPELTVRGQYNAAEKTYTLDINQRCPATPGQVDKLPFHIPLALGFVGRDGADQPLQLAQEPNATPGTRVLSVKDANQSFTFINVAEEPVPSLLRNFSAPVKLNFPYSRPQLVHLLAHDSDAFCRWEAGQTLMLQDLQGLIDAARTSQPLALKDDFVAAMRLVLTNETLDPALVALMLTLPAETYLADQQAEIDPDAIRAGREAMKLGLARALRNELRTCYSRMQNDDAYQFEATAVAQRSLKNVCLSYLTELDELGLIELAKLQYNTANNMTDAQAALAGLVNWSEGDAALDSFAAKWADDALVMDKWFTLQALSRRLGTVAHVKKLMQHSAFAITNPNKVRSLIGALLHNNLAGFHTADGSGYTFAADTILSLDKLNPQVAARLAGSFNRWKKMEPTRRTAMRAELERLAAHTDLSRDVYEIVSKNLQ